MFLNNCYSKCRIFSRKIDFIFCSILHNISFLLNFSFVSNLFITRNSSTLTDADATFQMETAPTKCSIFIFLLITVSFHIAESSQHELNSVYRQPSSIADVHFKGLRPKALIKNIENFIRW